MIFTEPRWRHSRLGRLARAALGLCFIALALALALASASCGRGSDAPPPDTGPSRADSGASGGRTGDAGPSVAPDAAADTGAGDTSSTTPGDGGVSGDGGGNINMGCSLPRLTADLTRDWDAHLVVVSGSITLAGAVLPDSPGVSNRGNVVFRERNTNDVRVLPIGGTGPAMFAATLFTGTYDISFEAAATTSLVAIPVGAKTRLASAVTMTGNRTLAYDLRLATVSGTVTAGGAALPDSPTLATRGNLVFRERQSGDVRTLPVGAVGPGSFSGTVFAGDYDVSFETVSGSALVGLPASAETRVASGLALAGNRTLVYDVQVASVAGAITANGEELPDSPTLTTRGNLVFREQQSGDVHSFAVPASGAGMYTGLLFAGRYDVSFQTPTAAAGLVGVPAGSTTRLANATAISGSATHDYDLPIATVAGTLTAGGGLALPDSPGLTTRGSVRFLERTTGLSNSFAVGGTGAGTFGGLLFAGTYDVSFVGNAATELVGLPPGGGKRVASAVAIAGNPMLSYDLPLTSVSGTITMAGAALPSSPALTNRGNIVFRDRETGVATSLPVGGSGRGAFSGALYASSYDVTFETVNSPSLVGLPIAAETRLMSLLALSGDQTVLAYDTQVITVSGQVTLDGADLPDSPTLATRGNLLLREKLSGDVRTLPLTAIGPGTFSGLTFAGSYDVSFRTSAATGLVGLPLASETNLEVGCLPALRCTDDPTDLSGNWTFTFRDQVSWIRWNVGLVQTGTDLRGQFIAASGYSGQFDSGGRTGDLITLSSTQNTSTCVLHIDAIVSDGCFMAGIGSCAGGVSQSPFVGLR